MFLIGTIFVIVFALMVHLRNSANQHSATRTVTPYEIQRRIRIHFEPQPLIYPSHWYKPPISARAVPLKKEMYQRTLTIIEHALSKYPDDFDMQLEEVYVLERLEFYGIAFGASYVAPSERNRLLLTNNSYPDEMFVRLFHAEYSSVLLKLYPQFFNEGAWLAKLPHGLSYSEPETSDVALLQLGEALEQKSPELLVRGFLSHYATTNIENDFNSVVKHLFVPDSTFKLSDLRHYPLVQAKADLAIRFYSQVHPGFSAAYFEQFSL